MKKLLATSFILSFLFLLFFIGKVSANPNFAPPGFVARDFFKPVCTSSDPSTPRCHAKVVTDKDGNASVSGIPSGYSPAQFLKAYKLGTGLATSGSVTLAIIDAYDDPNIKTDLDKYNSTFGLPFFPSCTSGVTTSCFKKVNQLGQTSSYPAVNAGWALETSLDVEVAHAICQNCKILLVEANSNSYANLMAAVDTARSLGANVISNSYGSSEFSGETTYDSHFQGSSAAITFSSGDAGYGVEYPAASKYVTAVGGTTLQLNSDYTWKSESVWNGAGSGCSAFEPKPSFQTDNLCSNRTVTDISADADPVTGAAVYDSVRYQGKSGWFKVGGTSLASPLIAGTYALSGNYARGTMYNSLVATSLHDVLTGSNGNCGNYLCTAGTGYDGPTGMGTPKGAGAF
ncbi:MAG TPA: S53 family peptidase [Patescibacteria group bacterium]|nr:S53 family peptidase [Patescibacteria group bacterium]